MALMDIVARGPSAAAAGVGSGTTVPVATRLSVDISQTGDFIAGYEFTPDSAVTVQVYDSQGGTELFGATASLVYCVTAMNQSSSPTV